MQLHRSRRFWLVTAFVMVMTSITMYTSLYQLATMPAGANGDVSWNSIEVLDWLDYGIWPHFIYAIHGPEPVIVYLSAIPVLLFGVTIEASRLITAIGNVLFVLLLLPTIWWLFRDSLTEDQRLLAGCLAVLSAATSIHLAELSRVGVQGTLMPPIVLLAVLCSAYAWQNNRHWQWILAGLTLSLVQYTYQAGRMIALVAAVWLLHNFIFSRKTFMQRWRGWIVMGISAIVFTLPNLYFFLTAPQSFSNRLVTSADTATGSLIWEQNIEFLTFAWQKVLVTLQAVVFRWDASRKVTDYSVLEPLFVVGLIAVMPFVIARFRKIGYAWPITALPLFLLPSILFTTSLEISPIRQSSMLPFWHILSAVGLMHLGYALRGRVPKTVLVTLGILVVGWSVFTIAHKFHEYQTVLIPQAYASEQFAWQGSQTDVDLSNYINANAEDTYLLPYSEYTRQNIAWLVAKTFRDRKSVFLDEGSLVYEQLPAEIRVIIPADPERARHDMRAALYTTRNWVLLHDGQVIFLPMLREDEEQSLLRSLDNTEASTISGTSGVAIASEHTIPLPDFLDQPDFQPAQQMDVTFQVGDQQPELHLVGYRTSETNPQPGRPFYVTLYWEVLRKPTYDYDIFVQIWDDAAQVYGGTHHLPFEGVFRTRLWQPNTVVPSQHVIYMNEGEMPIGRYSMAVGLHRPLHGDNLRVTGERISPDQSIALANDFRVIPIQTNEPFTAEFQFDDLLEAAFQVDGYEDDFSIVIEGDTTLRAQLQWHVLNELDRDYSYFLHLTSVGEVQPIVQADAALSASGLPSGVWRVADQWQQEVLLPLEGLEPGTYELWFGVYHYADGVRLQTTNDQPTTDGRILVGQIEVR